MTTFIQKHKNRLWLPLSFLLPAFLITTTFAILGIYPFGEQSILSKDMFTQYVSYFSYYQSLFTSEGHTIFYSFSKLLGGDMFGFFAYYLISPFNLVCLFFDKANLPVALLLITVLKFGTSGLTMFLFLGRKKAQNTALTLALSTSYALMSYQIAFHINLMWLDCVLLAPLVLWGIEKLVHERKWNLYVFSLAAAIMSNYYIGFMLCLFCCIYFVYVSSQGKRPLKDFVGGSLLAGGLSSIIWLPTLLSLRGGIKNDFSLSSLRISADCDFLDLFSRIYMGGYTTGPYANKLPYLFCGIAVLFLVLHFFMNPLITLLRKRCAFAVISIFLASFYIEALDLIWHGFSEPIGFPFRYSFLFCLFLIDLAHTGAQELSETSSYSKNSKRILCLFIGLTFLLEKFDYEWLYTKIFILEWICLIVFAYLLSLQLQKRRNRLFDIILPLGIIAIVSLDLLLNAFLMMRQFTYEPYEKYTEYVDSLGGVVESIQFKESSTDSSSFYRMEKQLQMAANDPLLFGYYGVSHFSSTVVEQEMDLMEHFGFERNTTYAFYNTGSTMAVDSLLGIKYIASYKPLYQSYSIPFSMNGLYVNQNPFALPLGFMVDSQTLDSVATEDSFQLQNKIFYQMSSMNKQFPLFTQAVTTSTNLQNLTLVDSGQGIYEKIERSQKAALNYLVTTTEKGPLYARFTSSQFHRADILVNGTSVSHYFTEGDNGILLLGEFEADEKVDIQVHLLAESLSLIKPYFYSMNVDLLADYYREFSAQPYEMTRLSDSHLKGTISSDGSKSHLLLTIPSSDGWTLKIDGKKIEPKEAYDAFLLVPVTPGTHSLELLYRPVGLYVGGFIAFLSILILLLKRRHNVV